MYGCDAMLLAMTAAMVAMALTLPKMLKRRTLKALNTSGYRTRGKSSIGTGNSSTTITEALETLVRLRDALPGLTKFSYSAAAAAAAAAGPVKGTRSSVPAICDQITHASDRAATREGKNGNPRQSMATYSIKSMV